MHKKKLIFAADINHQNQTGKHQMYTDERELGIMFSICLLLTLHK